MNLTDVDIKFIKQALIESAQRLVDNFDKLLVKTKIEEPVKEKEKK